MDYSYDNLNRIIKISDKDTEKCYTYDEKGRLTSLQHEQDGKYNENSKMAKIYVRPGHTPYVGEINYVHQPTHETEYIMDMTKAYNNLLIKTEDGRPQKYLWDEEPAIFEDEEETGYYCMDDLGSPVRVLLTSGRNDLNYEYDEYGKGSGWDSKEVQPFGYTGYINDPVSQLYFAQARYYNPNIGRFTGKDARSGILTEPLTLNSYLYCICNPLIYIDPDGETPSFTAAGGTEAHKTLQAIVKSMYGIVLEQKCPLQGIPIRQQE